MDEYGVARSDRNVAGRIIGQLPAQGHGHGLVGLVAVGHGYALARASGKTAGGGNDVKQSRLANHRIDPGFRHLAQQAYALGSGLIDVQSHVWILYEPAVRKPLFDQGLSFFDGEAGQMDVVDEWKVDVAAGAQPAFGGQFRHVVDIHFNQIAGTQPWGRSGFVCCLGEFQVDRVRVWPWPTGNTWAGGACAALGG